ncbi:MAG: hypothetical protein NXI24_17185 [bacterium]|nr:hypothetical protein [bacterium]
MVQRGLGRTRTVQPLYTARYARDAAPAALPAITTHRGGVNIARQAEANVEDEESPSGDLSRSPADGVMPGEDEENPGQGPLVQTKALNVSRRSNQASTGRIQRQADSEEDEAAGAGDGGGDPGGADAGLASQAGEQTAVPEDEDLAPGRDSDTLLPKIQRRSIPNANSQPRIFRQGADEDSEDSPDAGAVDAGPQSDEESVQTSREAPTIARRAAGPHAAPAMNAQAANMSSRNTARQAPAATGPAAPDGLSDGAFAESAFVESVGELLMPTEPAGVNTAGAIDPIASSSPEPATPRSHKSPTGEGAEIVGIGLDGSPARPTRESSSGARSPAMPPAPGRRSEAAPGPEIQISIGRIEIRAVGDEPEAAPTAPYAGDSGAAGQMQSLQEYLKRRNGEVQ